jgi:hypothetical protein
MRTKFKKVIFVIVPILFAALVYAADSQSETCQPAPDGQGCSQTTCPDSNEQCTPQKIRVNYNGQVPTYTVLECRCLDLQTDCHININPQFEVYCTGLCPDPNKRCKLIEIDNGDGTIDYECNCDSIRPELFLDDPPGKATNVSPANGATGISRSGTTLTWIAGSDAAEHVVYFDITDPPQQVAIATMPTVTYPTGVMTQGQLYYWHVDARNGAGTTIGDTWSFRVEECMKSIAPEYNDWVEWDRPSCWCCRRQCNGDADCKKTIFWVSLTDLNCLKQNYGKPDNLISDICCDFNHHKNIQRVQVLDLIIIKNYFNKSDVPCCDNDGDCILVPADKYAFWTN